MTGTRTLYARLSELPLDAPAPWLSTVELAAWSGMRSPDRKATWLAGRIVAKRLLLELLAGEPPSWADLHASSIGIDSLSTRAGHGERPEVTFAGQRIPVALSIAHTERGALAAAAMESSVSSGGTIALGVDLVAPTEASSSLHWTFTDAERLWLASSTNHARCAARLWGMKEAIYKASQRGEGFTPREIDVTPGQAPRYPQRNTARNLIRLQSWCIDGQVAALAIVKHAASLSSRNETTSALAPAA